MNLLKIFQKATEEEPEATIELQAEKLFPRRRKRSFSATSTGRLYGDWPTSAIGPNSALRMSMRTIRVRSRALCKDDPYARRFLRLLETNVIGAKGIILQNKAKDTTGELDSEANEIIEAAWKEWGKKENASVNKKYSWKDITKLVIKATARDGEVFIRLVRGFNNPFGFAIQIITASHVDEHYNIERLSNGNHIQMGIEFNKWKEPIAYHVLVKNPDEGFYIGNQKRQRIPANEIIHFAVTDDPDEVRSLPWMHSTMARLKMLSGYEEAELVAARVASSKMAFIKQEGGEEFTGDDEDTDGNVIIEADPGTFPMLAHGQDIVPFDPQHPTSAFDKFCKHILRGVCAGIGVSYNTLALDLEKVNFSSLRQGILDDRDSWEEIQGFIIEHLIAPVFEVWLRMALLTQKVPLPASKFDKFNSPLWQARRWSWVDPKKEAEANSIAIRQGYKSRTQIIAESGGDVEEIFQQQAYEEALAEKLGLILGAKEGA